MSEPYKLVPHVFTDKVLNWNVCIHCGLIALKNDFTHWAIKKGCNNQSHPDYQQRRKATGPK